MRREETAPPEDSGRRALGLIGLAARAGAVVTGVQEVRLAARSGRLQFVLIAGDASDNSRGKLVPLLEARGIDYLTGFDRATLGAATGKAPLSALGVLNPSFASQLRTLLAGPPDAPTQTEERAG